MKHNNHNSFILTSITKILEEAISATIGIGDGIETYALYDYVMQSVFLKMTGAQEQKMKCICWELATNDYVYRYDRYKKNPIAGCSQYKEKEQIYKDIINQIPNFELEDFDNYIDDSKKIEILFSVYNQVKQLFKESSLKKWNEKEYIFFESNFDKIFKTKNGKARILEKKENAERKENMKKQSSLFYKIFPQKNNSMWKNKKGGVIKKGKIQSINLFDNELILRYEQLYHHRNRCAHNTLSYQRNLPTLDTLRGEEYVYENYFIYFSILILIDEIMMKLYQKYLEVIE